MNVVAATRRTGQHALVALVRSTVLPLCEVLQAADEMSWLGDHLYVEGTVNAWDPSSRCAVIGLDPYEEEPDRIELGDVVMGYALAAFQVQDVVTNLRATVAQPTGSQLVAALRYYYEYDSFMDPNA